MLFKVSFFNSKNVNQSFFVSGITKEKCKELAKIYIRSLGGAIGVAKIKRVRSIE
ncbi:hypothetical protein [Clostridium tertium]|uniref:hypothetical protein n=1 Tax=Clostridium tertium TaxID=1559 RepID=UPI0015966CE1|nr:hypothetical protein [Clostridium tertium]